MSRHPVVLLAFALVVGTGLALIVALIVPPWSSPDRGPYTKLNLSLERPLAYSRTLAAWVGELGSTMPTMSSNSPAAPPADGAQLYMSSGCASCHGLYGRGAVVANPVAGLPREVIEAFVRAGPLGMPAYSEEDLSPEDLELIAQWLSTLERASSSPSPALRRFLGEPPRIPLNHFTASCGACHEKGLGAAPQWPDFHVGFTEPMCSACHQKTAAQP